MTYNVFSGTISQLSWCGIDFCCWNIQCLLLIISMQNCDFCVDIYFRSPAYFRHEYGCCLFDGNATAVVFVSAETVCSYHTAGVQYGQPSLVHSCIGWLEKTLLPLQSAELLRSIRFLLPVMHIVHCMSVVFVCNFLKLFCTCGWLHDRRRIFGLWTIVLQQLPSLM